MNGIQLSPHPSEDYCRNLALERILDEWLAGALPEWEQELRKFSDSDYKRSALEVLRRDGFRCRRCGHTRLNSGGVDVHHIVPRSYYGPERPKDIHDPSNLITLCKNLCHKEITHPEGAHQHWRAVADELKSLIGDSSK